DKVTAWRSLMRLVRRMGETTKNATINNRRKRRARLEKALRNLDAIAGLKSYVLRGIAAHLADIVDFCVVTAKQTHSFLIGKVIEAAGRINGGEQCHILSKGNS